MTDKKRICDGCGKEFARYERSYQVKVVYEKSWHTICRECKVNDNWRNTSDN
jgi:hypothetical protein